MNPIAFRVYEITEYTVLIDPQTIPGKKKYKMSKQFDLSQYVDSFMRAEALLSVGRLDYIRKKIVNTDVFREGDPSAKITINENFEERDL